MRWYGIEFVALAGLHTAMIDPERAGQLFEAWTALPLDTAPTDSEQAMTHPHAAVRCVSRRSEDDEVRRCATHQIAEFEPDGPAAAVDLFAEDLERSVAAAEFMRTDCLGFHAKGMQGYDQRARVGEGDIVRSLTRSYARDPDHSVIRIVVARRDVANADALGLRRALLEAGVPLHAIDYERIPLPSLKEKDWRYLIVARPSDATGAGPSS